MKISERKEPRCCSECIEPFQLGDTFILIGKRGAGMLMPLCGDCAKKKIAMSFAASMLFGGK